MRAASRLSTRLTIHLVPALPLPPAQTAASTCTSSPRPTPDEPRSTQPTVTLSLLLSYYPSSTMAFLCCCSSFTRSQMPDLSLSLLSSSNTFLIGLIVDKDTRKPVYSIDTVESITSVVRQTAPTTPHRARESRTRSHTPAPPSQSLVASVQWPERSPHIVPLHPGVPRSSTLVNPTRDEDGVRLHFDDGSVIPLLRFLKRRSQALYVRFAFVSPSPSVSIGDTWADHWPKPFPHIYVIPISTLRFHI